MITTAIITLFIDLASGVLTLLPNVTIDTTSMGFTTGLNIITSIACFLPMETIAIILGIIVAINGFKIGVSVLKTIWDVLPLL